MSDNKGLMEIKVVKEICSHHDMCGNSRGYEKCPHLILTRAGAYITGCWCDVFDKDLSFNRCSNKFPDKCEDCINAEPVRNRAGCTNL